MSILGAKPEFCRVAVAGEPFAVRAGYDPVPATVHQQGRSDYPRRIEPPRCNVGEIVVYQSDWAVLHRRTDDAYETGPLAFERGDIGRNEAGFVVFIRSRLVTLFGRAPLCGSAKRSRAGVRHAREKVQPLGVERGHPGHAEDTEDAVGQQRGACQSMRTAAGMAHNREPVYAQRVGDARDVGCSQCHVAVLVGGGSTVARPVVGDPPYAQPIRGLEEGFGRRTDVRRAVMPEDGKTAIRIVSARVVHVQRTTVAQA